MDVVDEMGISINIDSGSDIFKDVEEACAEEKNKILPSIKDEDYISEVNNWIKEHVNASLMIMNAEKSRCAKMKADLHNSCLQGNNNYPSTTANSLKLL